MCESRYINLLPRVGMLVPPNPNIASTCAIEPPVNQPGVNKAGNRETTDRLS